MSKTNHYDSASESDVESSGGTIKYYSDNESDEEVYDSETDESEEYYEDDIRNIIVEDIDEKFAYSKLGDFEVILMKKNGYINATKLCSSAGKKLTHWNENKTSKKFIAVLASVTEIPSTDLTVIIFGGNNPKITGTYVHPKIIIHIASWCSPEYAIQVSDIVIQFHAKEAIYEKDRLLKKKTDTKIRTSETNWTQLPMIGLYLHII